MLLGAIFVSCFVLAIEPPSDDIPGMIESISSEMLQLVDFIAFIFFAVEFLVRTIQLGVRPYLRNPWNSLDAGVLLLALLGLLPSRSFWPCDAPQLTPHMSASRFHRRRYARNSR